MEPERQPRLPIEIFLLIANYLDPQNLLLLLNARPGIASLLSHAHLQSVDSEGNTLLHLVAECNIDNVISRLSPTTAAKSMVENNAGQTPLHVAVKKGHYGIVQELLSTGCNPSPIDKHSRSPLHYACQTKQDTTIVQLLLAHGADASAKDKEGRTPIHICCTHGQVALLKTLIHAGADINAAENGSEVDPGAQGQTPFHNAVLCGQTECAKRQGPIRTCYMDLENTLWAPQCSAGR
jgi:ankyrin repeat protein